MRTILVVFACIAVAFGVAVFAHPDGTAGVMRMLAIGDGATDNDTPILDGDPATGGARAAAANEILKAERALDEGRFRDAVTFFGVALVTSKTETQRDRASRGRDAAILGWALLRDGPSGGDIDGLISTAESTGREEDWLAAARAAGAGRAREAPRLIAAVLDVSRAGGPADKALRESLAFAGPLRSALADAMINKGFEVQTATTSRGTDMTPTSHSDASDGTTSGIGGTSGVGSVAPKDLPRIGVPFGSFSKDTRKRLERAVQAHRLGLHEFKLAGPDGSDREKHRTKAYALLVEARDVYNDASEEDGKSSGLQKNIQNVNRALASLRKERTMGE